jgi:carbamoyl-phosphate synthase large subunit
LVKYFKEALKGQGKVHASNSSWTTALETADEAVLTPLIYDESYIQFLLEYCNNNQINVIISLFDIDLPVLAKSKQMFRDKGIVVIVSDYDVTQICNDKWSTYQFLKENNFRAPLSFITLGEAKAAIGDGDLRFPVILKPRWGMGSISIFKAENDLELGVLYDKVQREINDSYLKYESKLDPERAVIIQQFMKGQEYGLDIVNDLDKKYVTTFVKKKTAMRSGETDGAVTEQNDILSETGKCIAEKLGHIANLDTDCFLIDDNPYILEINCRFGGGYPFSHLAGADLPTAILKWISKEKLDSELNSLNIGIEGNKDIQIVKFKDKSQCL